MAIASKSSWPPFRLNNNIEMPAVGLGTIKMREEEDIMRTVDVVLASGCRLFDTAAVYANEPHLKKALETYLPKYELEREDIFIVSKLGTNEMYSKKIVKDAYEKSIKKLGTDYLDLFLMQFPGQYSLDPKHPKCKLKRNTAWATLTDLYDSGSINAIGLCNFPVNCLQELMNDNHSVVPVVNQVEWHPYFHDDEVFKFCHENEIILQGYSQSSGHDSNGDVLKDRAVKSIADDLSVTPEQVLLVWSLQMDVATITKSTDPDQIRANFQLDFKLNVEQMKIINNLQSKKKIPWDSYPYF